MSIVNMMKKSYEEMAQEIQEAKGVLENKNLEQNKNKDDSAEGEDKTELDKVLQMIADSLQNLDERLKVLEGTEDTEKEDAEDE